MSNLYFVIADIELKNLLERLRGLEASGEAEESEKREVKEKVTRRQNALKEALSYAARKWMKEVRDKGNYWEGNVELEDKRGKVHNVETTIGLKTDQGAFYIFPKPPEVPRKVCRKIADAIREEVMGYMVEQYNIGEKELMEEKVYCG